MAGNDPRTKVGFILPVWTIVNRTKLLSSFENLRSKGFNFEERRNFVVHAFHNFKGNFEGLIKGKEEIKVRIRIFNERGRE